ncbi:MAG: 5'-3' exonuclease H3TH domain-containing protein, partial [Negativicoccus succinicivorans]|nr:5'-3' exonuclease H3TH domain-containing protein [Negativicoccus succinicivorans]
MSKSRLVLIDGNSLLYRAFFALPALTDPQGNPTNAVYGFLLMLAKVFEDLKPTYLAVAFDKGRVTFRNELYADYKGNRPDAPDDLAPQFGLIREVLQTLGIAQYEKEGYEGDDLIGTLSKRYRDECDVAIITGDRDTLQLVDDATTVYLTKRGVTQLEAMTPETVLESTGVTTEQIVDWKALMGDTSDNIPGIAGIGPKTASKLLQQFLTLDEIFARLDEVSGKKLVERLTENKDIAYVSRELATIKTDVEISTDLSEMEPQGRVDEARTLFERLGFRSMLGKMQAAHIIAGDEGLFAQPLQEEPADMVVVTDAKPSVLKDADRVAVSVTTAGKIPHLALKELAALVDDTL